MVKIKDVISEKLALKKNKKCMLKRVWRKNTFCLDKLGEHLLASAWLTGKTGDQK